MEKRVLKAVRGGGPDHPHIVGSSARLWDAWSLGSSFPGGRRWRSWGAGVGVQVCRTLGRVLGARSTVQGVSAVRVRVSLPVPSPLPLQAVKSPSTPQASSEKIWRAGKLLFIHLTSTHPGLIRDHKHHLRHHRWDGQHPCHAGGHRGLLRTPAALRGGQDFCCPSQTRAHLGCRAPQPPFGGRFSRPLPLQAVLLREGAGGLAAERRACRPDAQPGHWHLPGAGGRRRPDTR